MNRNIQAGEMPFSDLTEIQFPDGYVIPRSGTIAAGYQQGFRISDEIENLWNSGHGSEIAAEFVKSYYGSKGFEDAVDMVFLRDDPDSIGGVLVTAKDKAGFDYTTYAVWQTSGKIYVAQC